MMSGNRDAYVPDVLPDTVRVVTSRPPVWRDVLDLVVLPVARRAGARAVGTGPDDDQVTVLLFLGSGPAGRRRSADGTAMLTGLDGTRAEAALAGLVRVGLAVEDDGLWDATARGLWRARRVRAARRLSRLAGPAV